MNDLITRREAIARVAYLLGGALSATTVAGVLAGCDRRAPEAAAKASALTADQKEMVAVLADHILPETDTPGARTAGVPDFIDLMMAEYYPPEERARFTAGLARVDQRAQRAFGVPLLRAKPEQQLQLVQALNRQAFNDPAAQLTSPAEEPILRETETETGRSDAEGTQAASAAVMLDRDWDPEDVGGQSFFRTLKELVLVGYYTSEVGATQELRMNPMGTWRADIPYGQGAQAWA
ncbi:MAG: gluconate 2-dehydrogenase subunit 3 family protein [Gemmatimonadetes bacterium]|nr:gluconate 2-dehydrogenase subunit 3 family protein [Gemmatimonadota bacterium]